MLSYEEFLFETPDLKPVKSPQAIARKHNVPLEQITAALQQGIEIEKEHTNKIAVARKIALAHLDELPDYYEKLKKVEKEK